MPSGPAVNQLQKKIDELGDQYRFAQKTATIKRRLTVLCDDHWDVNMLIIIYRDLSCLGASLKTEGQAELAARIHELRSYLQQFSEHAATPGQSQLVRIRKLLDQIAAGDGHDGQSRDAINELLERSVRVKSGQMEDPEIEINGLPGVSNIPTMLVPANGFLPFESESTGSDQPQFESRRSNTPFIDPDLARMTESATELSIGNLAEQIVTGEDQYDIEVNTGQFTSVTDLEAEESIAVDEGDADEAAADMSDDDIEQLSAAALAGSDTAGGPEKATVSDTAGQEATPRQPNPVNKSSAINQPIVYILHQPATHLDHIVSVLEADHEIHCFNDPAEFREVLGALAPDGIIVEASQGENLDQISPLIGKLREKQSSPVPLITICDYSDLSQRLHLMRAGADAVMKTSVTPDELRLKLDELLQMNAEDPYRILIVEDDRSQGMFAETILRKSGMMTRLEPDAMNVLTSLNEFMPDLILMDLHMPDVNGLELTTIIRENPDFVDTPIVFLSGENDTDTQFDALRAGGDDFLSKPIRPRHLMQAVTNRAQRARSRSLQRNIPRIPALPELEEAAPITVTDRTGLVECINNIISGIDDPTHSGGLLARLALNLKVTSAQAEQDALNKMILKGLKSMARDGECVIEDNAGKFLVLTDSDSFDSGQQRIREFKQGVINELEKDSLITEAASIFIGMCEITRQLDNGDQAIEKAQQAFDQALKSKSTDQIGIIRSKPKVHTPDTAFEHQVVNAIKERRLKLLFQPMVGLKSESEECYHGLIRLEDENEQVIPARDFLPVAEKLGVHKKLDQWVFFKSLAMIANRKRLGQPVNLVINQSPWVFTHSKWVEWVEEQITKREVDPSNVIVEFKLPAVIKHMNDAVKTYERLLDIGVQLSLGHFTATPRAFELIEQLPVHYAKLPNSVDIAEQPDMAVDEIVGRLHEHGQKVIIPGIEDAATAAQMWTTGADYLQGNFIQEPDFRLDFEFSQRR